MPTFRIPAAVGPRTLLASLLLFGLAGCGAPAEDFAARASDARIIPRGTYAYDGEGVLMAEGELDVGLDNDEDDGWISATVRQGNHVYDVEWTGFSATTAYQDGGVVRNQNLCGTTGRGSAELPEFFAYAAAWGTALVKTDGEVERDPTTLASTFGAHLFVARGHVREPNSGVIRNTAGGAYDPNRPDDFLLHGEGAQAVLQVRTASRDLWYQFEFEDVVLERA